MRALEPITIIRSASSGNFTFDDQSKGVKFVWPKTNFRYGRAKEGRKNKGAKVGEKGAFFSRDMVSKIDSETLLGITGWREGVD